VAICLAWPRSSDPLKDRGLGRAPPDGSPQPAAEWFRMPCVTPFVRRCHLAVGHVGGARPVRVDHCSATKTHSYSSSQAADATRRALQWPLGAVVDFGPVAGCDGRTGSIHPAIASNSGGLLHEPTCFTLRATEGGAGGAPACWAGGRPRTVGALHISLPGWCTVTFRYVTVGLTCSVAQSLYSVSLCGSAPLSAIGSVGLSGRGGQGDPCP
jgi:hypothetical protein